MGINLFRELGVWNVLKLLPLSSHKIFAGAWALAAALAWSLEAEAKTGQPAVFLKEHSEMQGDVDFLVGKNGFSLVFRNAKMALYMQAPLWHVVYANLKSKVYCDCRPENWKGNPSVLSALVRPSSPTSLRLTGFKQTNYMGLPCQIHSMETKEASRGTDRVWKRLLPKEGKIWLYPQQGFPRQAYQMAANLLALPCGPGIPIAMEFSKFDGQTTRELRLYGFENRQVTIDEFAPPRGFKKVADQAAVLNNTVESKDFADFLDEK